MLSIMVDKSKRSQVFFAFAETVSDEGVDLTGDSVSEVVTSALDWAGIDHPWTGDRSFDQDASVEYIRGCLDGAGLDVTVYTSF